MKQCYVLFKNCKLTKTNQAIPEPFSSIKRIRLSDLDFLFQFLKKTLSLLVSSLIFLYLVFPTFLHAQITNKTVFPLNDYLTVGNGSPYPVLVQSKLDEIDTSKFVSVMDYGAAGDGKTLDDDAIKDAFTNARYGVIFPAGKVFLVSKLTKISLNRDLTVYAYGATIKMNDLSRYSFLSLEYEEDGYHNNCIWMGGTFNGNKRRQSWPGSPTGNDEWEEDHGRFFGICNAQFALVKDVTCVNTVVDGIGLEACKIAVIADSKASGGAPIAYAEVNEQGTYFKCTRSGSQAFYCMNLTCTGGSIGVHYSTRSVEDNSLAVITNSYFNNQYQDALHFEDCKKIFMYQCTVSKDASKDYTADIHISNSTQIASIKSCLFTNARVDFRNATSLEIGVIDSCQFVSENVSGNATVLETCLGGATHCINSSFTGITSSEQVWADNVQNCTFKNFGDLGLRGAHVADDSYFENGGASISPAKGGVVVNCSYKNVDDANYKQPDNDEWKNVFSSYITIVNDKGKYLGTITCGSDDGITKQSVSAISKMSSIANLQTADLANKAVKTSQVHLYPNPVANKLHITLDEHITGNTSLLIYNSEGRLLKTQSLVKRLPTFTYSLDIHTLATGSYILQIINGNRKIPLKFLIIK